jgi:hypothetical protein
MAKHVNLNTEELKTFIRHIVENNRHLQAEGKNPIAINVEGEAGIGKTSSILQLKDELGLDYVKLNLSQIEELGDLVGFPVRQFQLCKPNGQAPVAQVVEQPKPAVKYITKIVDGKLTKVALETPTPTAPESVKTVDSGGDCEWVDERAIDEYLKRGYEFTGKKRMSYCPPEWIADKKGGGFLIIDDWTRSDMRFIQAIMELIDRQEYISWKLPKDWHIVLTANPDNGDYLVNSIDPAQKTRFVSTFLKFDEAVWAKWAESAGIDSRCINFLLMHPELVSQHVNPRAITTFFNAISSIKDFSTALPLIQMIGEGSVGMEFSTQFTLFINNKLDKLVKPQDILLHENEGYIIGELRSCIGTGKDYRADIASILTTRIVNYALFYAESHTIANSVIKRLIRLTTEEELLANDLKYVLIKGILNGNKVKFQSLMMDPKVIKIAAK